MMLMMNQDHKLAYCVITYTLALAHHDKVFKSERLTPELMLRLCVPDRIAASPRGMVARPLDEPSLHRTARWLLVRAEQSAVPDDTTLCRALRRWGRQLALCRPTDRDA